MQDGVFGTTDIDIDRKPVIKKLLISDGILVVWIDISGHSTR